MREALEDIVLELAKEAFYRDEAEGAHSGPAAREWSKATPMERFEYFQNARDLCERIRRAK